MTTKILPRATVKDMVKQLEELGGVTEKSATGYVVKAPNGKEALRAMIGRDGSFLTRWMDGLFDERQTAQNRG